MRVNHLTPDQMVIQAAWVLACNLILQFPVQRVQLAIAEDAFQPLAQLNTTRPLRKSSMSSSVRINGGSSQR